MENLQISPEKRTTGAWDSFATWVNANANNGTWFTGGVIAAAGVWTASVDLVIVGLISYAFLSIAAYMGYKTGLPAMYLTRPSFGVRGSVLPSMINIIQFMGWAAANTFIAAVSMAMMLNVLFKFPAINSSNAYISIGTGIFIMMILHLLSVSMGEKSIRMLERFGIWLIYILVLWEMIVVFHDFSWHQLINWRPTINIKISSGKVIDTMAVFNLGWAMAGSDFSRFAKNKKSALVVPFIGVNIGTWWFASIGMFSTIAMALSLHNFNPENSDSSVVATKLGLGLVALLVIVITSTTSNAVSLLAAGSAYNNVFKRTSFNRSLVIVTILASLISFIPLIINSFLASFTAFLSVIGMTMIPVIPIFLIDFYIFNNQKYDISALDKVGGVYWYSKGINWIAVISWGIGVLAYNLFQRWTMVSDVIGASFESLILAGFSYFLLTRILRK